MYRPVGGALVDWARQEEAEHRHAGIFGLGELSRFQDFYDQAGIQARCSAETPGSPQLAAECAKVRYEFSSGQRSGAAIGGVAGIALGLGVGWWFWKRRR